MDLQKFALPAVAFAVGAVLGRMLGLKRLIRGAMTAAALTGIGTAQPALTAAAHRAPARRKPVHRAARKRTAQKRSPRVVAAHE